MMAPYETTDSHRESNNLAFGTQYIDHHLGESCNSHFTPQVLLFFWSSNPWVVGDFPTIFRVHPHMVKPWQKNDSDYTKFRPHLSRCPTPDSAFSLAPRLNHPKPLLKICFNLKSHWNFRNPTFFRKTQMLHTRVKVDGYLSSLNWLFNHENS